MIARKLVTTLGWGALVIWVLCAERQARRTQCCEFTGEFEFGELVVCEHARAWVLGPPQYWELGPFGFARDPGWQEVSAARAVRMMGSDLNEELAAIQEAGTEE